MELPPLECAYCRSLNARHAVFCAFCGKTLRTSTKRGSRASWRELALSGACWTLFLGICGGVGLTIWNLYLPPPLVIEGSRLVEYTPGADKATLVCSRCRGLGRSPQGDWNCEVCQGRGQVTVAVPRRRLVLLSERYPLCPRCNGLGWVPQAINPRVSAVLLGGYRLSTMTECKRCQGTGYLSPSP